MRLDIAAIQHALADEGLDGWLLYDFHGSNPIAAAVVGLAGSGKMTTRRWYYLVPRAGAPRALTHAIERHNLSHLPGESSVYASRESLERELDWLLSGIRRVAMEYSPNCAIPYLSRIDAGTVDALRARGLEISSSGDLVQRFQAVWDERAYALHREASAALYRIKDRAFGETARRLRDGVPTTEHDIQGLMVGWFDEAGLISDSPPIVGAREHAGDPHYMPSAEASATIAPNEVLLLDLWGKTRDPGAVYADITWVGFTGPTVPAEVERAFAAVASARDAAVSFVRGRAGAGADVRGWEVDRAARSEIERAGLADHVLHRTGHSLGEEVHGNGVHMDDYETHDDRRLLPGTAFTVEPGLYFDTFGVRTEINVLVTDHDALVTGPAQDRVVTLID
jgi:Xaa-Pro aminopeptidase